MSGSGSVPVAARDAYWAALADGDPAAAVEVAVGLHEDGFDLVHLLDELVAGAQAEVGRRWATNDWNVAQEHRATSVSEEVVAALSARADPAVARGAAVVTCVDGEWHSLPSRVVATGLRADGWRVHYLGASVPVSHLVQLLHDIGPDLTAISCSVPTALVRAREMIEASRQAGVPVLAGGPGFGPGRRWARLLGADGTAAGVRDALRVVSGPDWPAFTSAAPAHEPPDHGHILLRRHFAAIVAEAMAQLAELWPPVRDFTEHQDARTEEDIGYLVEFLAAALFVDDVTLYTDFATWMSAVLGARGVPVAALDAGLEATGKVLSDLLGGYSRPLLFIAAARSELCGPAGADPGATG